MKILSPAGNLSSLKVAIINGADEVYLGLNSFNARNNIDGFTLDNLRDAVDYAHLHNVKVNLAINILFNNAELQTTLDTLIEAYNIGVDCFIIQDLGLAHLVHTYYPEIEIHASTQMGLHNLQGIQWVENFGFSRIVLARETPLTEIKHIKDNCNLELEYFTHGALCVSFSGNCYLSSYLHDASGNRGKCKQLCRLPYTLSKNGKQLKSGYLLSAKDFNMSERLQDLSSAGIDILKIEGRARRPYFVGITTREYTQALHGNTINQNNLKLGFNREYTAGYLDGNGKIISKYHNHIGIKVGQVFRVNKGKKFNEIYFSSNMKISPKSTLKFYVDDIETNTITAYDLKAISHNQYMVTSTQNIPNNSQVHLISDFLTEEELLNQTKKKDILLKIIAKENTPIKAVAIFNSTQIEILGDICATALNSPLSAEDIISSFNRNENFAPRIDILALDNVFLSKKQLNEFRRKVFEKVYNHIVESSRHNANKIKVDTSYKITPFKDYQIIDKIDAKLTAHNIIYSPEIYKLEDIVLLQKTCKKLNKQVYLDTPNFALSEDIQFLEDLITKTHIGIVANNYYALLFDTEIIIGAGLNVYNNITASIYDKPILTAESNISNKIKFPYMTLRHCPMKSHLNATCDKCPYSQGYTYTMSSGREFKLRRKKLSTCTFYLVD